MLASPLPSARSNTALALRSGGAVTHPAGDLASSRRSRGLARSSALVCAAAAAASRRRRTAAQAQRREVLLGPAVGSAGLVQPPPAPLELPNFGVGTWAWGDQLFWGYDAKNDAELRAAFDVCRGGGVRLYDTAEIYGFGRSEQLLGGFARESQADLVLATKFAALPWKLSRGDVVSACKASQQRLGSIGLYQIHFPSAWRNEEFWDGLGDCYEQGLVRAVGVSNYGSEALREVHRVLAARGVPLASNQVQYSLVYRYPELNGMKATCEDLGVKLLAYSPLGLGMLTGKFAKDRLPSGPRAAIVAKFLEDPAFAELITTMRDIATKYGPGTTPSQVAIAWCMAKGTVPIPGVRNARQAEENVRAASLALAPREVEDLDSAASRVTAALATAPFQRKSLDTGRVLFEA